MSTDEFAVLANLVRRRLPEALRAGARVALGQTAFLLDEEKNHGRTD